MEAKTIGFLYGIIVGLLISVVMKAMIDSPTLVVEDVYEKHIEQKK